MKERRRGKPAASPKAEGSGNRKVDSRIVSRESENTVRQYPARVGHHGTDAEKDLNPEE